MSKPFVGLIASLLLALGIASPALADPINNPHASYIEIVCNGETITIVTPSPQTPVAHVVGGSGVTLVSEVRGSYIDPETGETVNYVDVYGAGHGQAKGQQDDVITCTGAFDPTSPFEVDIRFVPGGQGKGK